MKSKSCAVFLFFIITVWIPADNTQRILPLDSPVYGYLESLILETGLSIPSTSRPFTAAETGAYLQRIPFSLLSEAGKKTYQAVINLLAVKPLYREQENFQFNPVLTVNLEAYVHSSTSGEEWEYGYERRKPLIEIPLQIYLFDTFYADLQPCLQKDPFVAESTETWNNIITDFSEVEGHFPFRGFFSLGGEHWNVQAGRDTLS